MIAALIGMMYRTPRRPRGIRRLRAASGPYAAELSASRPKIGMPCAGPICSARSSVVRMGLPTTRSSMFMSDRRSQTYDNIGESEKTAACRVLRTRRDLAYVEIGRNRLGAAFSIRNSHVTVRPDKIGGIAAQAGAAYFRAPRK